MNAIKHISRPYVGLHGEQFRVRDQKKNKKKSRTRASSTPNTCSVVQMLWKRSKNGRSEFVDGGVRSEDGPNGMVSSGRAEKLCEIIIIEGGRTKF